MDMMLIQHHVHALVVAYRDGMLLVVIPDFDLFGGK